MRRWIAVLVGLLLLASGVDFAIAQGFGLNWTGSGTPNQNVPTMVAGTAIPQSEDNANPSMSRWAPSCLSSEWGTGCNVSTQTCTAPSGGTPVETCQPPLQLYVTGGTGNGTTATIDYHSEAGYVFPTGTPLMISGATEAAWNTPIAKLTSLTFTNNGSACISATDWCATVGFSSTPGFLTTDPVYVGGMMGTLSPMTAAMWASNAASPGGQANQTGFGANVISGSCCTGGVLSLTIDNPIFGTTPSVGDYIIGGLAFASGSCTGNSAGLCVLDSRFTLQSSSGGGTVLNFTAPATQLTSVTMNGGYMSYEVGSQGPNGKWTPDHASSTAISYDINSSFPNGLDGAYLGPNQGGYDGTATQPWPVTASTCNIGGNPKSCSVSFANPTACSSSCVTVETAQSTSGTQIVAGQFSEPVMAWDSGPVVPLAIQGDPNNPNREVELCAAADHISSMRGVYFALDGGAAVEATTAILDPWGVGAAYNTNDPYKANVVNNNYVYCAQFPASSVADGEHEIRAWAVANAGPVGQLTSAITANASNGSATLASPSHHLSHNYRMAVTQSVDPSFPVYNGGTYNGLLTLASPYAVYSGGNVTYTYTLGTQLVEPITAGSLVEITNVVTSNSCSITGGSTTGAQITYTYSGGCSFPVGSTVNIAGLSTPTTQSVSISSIAYNSGTGVLSVTLPSAAWGTSPGEQYITQYTISGVTGTGCTSPNGAQPIIGFGGSGTILEFQMAKGLTVCFTGGTVQSNTYSWNGTAIPVVATNGSSNITVNGLSTAAYPGGSGTITENWNMNCVVSSAQTATSPYSITCPVPNAASTTVASTNTASINVNANLMCVNGGPADEPSPYDSTYRPESVMTPVHFEALPLLPNSCAVPANVGCHLEPCGNVASMNSTLWLYRKDAGTFEQVNNNTPIYHGNDGSFFVLTNSGGKLQERNAYVDTWNPSAVLSGCSSAPTAALSWDATHATYGGSYCANASYARSDLVYGNPYNTFKAATVSGNAPSCLVFTNATYFTNFYQGEAVAFSGVDAGSNGDGTNGVLNVGQAYYVYANLGSGQIELSRTGSLASCISAPSHTTITSANLSPDFSNTNIFFKCNTSLGCSTSNPELTVSNAEMSGGTFSSTMYGKLGWFSLLPDTANGTTQHEVDLISGCEGHCNQFSTTFGRAREGLDRSTTNITITPSNSIGPTLPVTTASGGSLVGTCNGADPACQETLTWSAETNCNDVYAPCTTTSYTGATFQNPNSSSGHDMPGQNIVISGSGNTAWNCGTATAPCQVLSSTNTSVTFLNSAATGAYSGSSTITPLSLAIELPTGTFPNNAGSPNCGNSSFQAITPSGGNTMCLASATINDFNGLAAGLFPVMAGNTSTEHPQTWVPQSNCIINNNGATGSYPVWVQSVTVNTGDLDVIVLGTDSTGRPVNAFNPCPSFQLSYGGFGGSTSGETWDSGNTINGPNWIEQTNSPYVLDNAQGGVPYITNASRYDVNGPSDYSGYTWGFSSIYNTGNCHNNAGTGFHIRCMGYDNIVPNTLGGGGSLNPPSITHTYASYKDYIQNNPILCSGSVDCITTNSRVYTLSDNGDGTIPQWLTLEHGVYANCNYGSTTTPMTGVYINKVGVTWFDQTHNVFEINAAPAQACNLSAGAIAFFGVTFHPDTLFWQTGPWNFPVPQEFASRGQWIVQGNVFISQFDSTGNGNTEGLFSEGGSYQNMAFENGTMANIKIPQPPPILYGGSIYLGSYGNVNWLVKNSNVYVQTATNTSYNANTSPSWYQQAPLHDDFWLNDSLGTSSLFPYNSGYTPSVAGAFTWTSQYFSDYSEQPSFGGTPLTLFNTGAIFPSDTWGVNASGVPSHAGQPSLYSLQESPWHTAVAPGGDPGTGLY